MAAVFRYTGRIFEAALPVMTLHRPAPSTAA